METEKRRPTVVVGEDCGVLLQKKRRPEDGVHRSVPNTTRHVTKKALPRAKCCSVLVCALVSLLHSCSCNCLEMTAASHQVVYAISTPPHGVVHYEYYTQQVPQTTTATPFAAFAQYSSSAPPPSGAIAMDQSADGAAKRLSDGGTQFCLLLRLILYSQFEFFHVY